MNRSPIRPDRARCVRKGFAAIENRFLHEGFFASLSHLERSLYLFLVLAGDRNGVSYYAYDRICGTLEVRLRQGVAPDRRISIEDSEMRHGRRGPM